LPWQRPLTNWKIIGTDPSWARKALSYGKKIVKIGPVHPEIFDKIRQTRNAISISIFSSKTTGPIFTNILHDVVALVALFNLAHMWRYPILFLNDRAISARGIGNFTTKLVAMATSLEKSEKVDLIKKIHANTFHLVKKS